MFCASNINNLQNAPNSLLKNGQIYVVFGFVNVNPDWFTPIIPILVTGFEFDLFKVLLNIRRGLSITDFISLEILLFLGPLRKKVQSKLP